MKGHYTITVTVEMVQWLREELDLDEHTADPTEIACFRCELSHLLGRAVDEPERRRELYEAAKRLNVGREI